MLDLIGKKYGKLLVLSLERHDNNTYKTFWRCKCDCGNECIVDGKYLRNGDTKSCGKCYKHEDLVGKRFGKLLVTERAENRGSRVYWKCLCDCGNIVERRTISLTHGKSTSCGHCKPFISSTMVGRVFGDLKVLGEHDGVCECLCSCGNRVSRTKNYLLTNEHCDCGHGNKGFHEEDLTGRRFGKLTVVGFDKDKSLWECKCDCGSVKYITKARLKSGDTKSCGCLLHDDKYVDIAGKRFGHLTALEMVGRDRFGKVLWKCICDCGNYTISPVERLNSGLKKSCGCVSVAHSGSTIENEIKEYIEKLSEREFKKVKILDGKEIDLYNDELKLGIEYNGSVYHASVNGVYDNKPKDYHQKKFLLAKEKGIHLLNIFDVDYDCNKDKILAYIRDIIEPKTRLYARKCEVREVDKSDAWDFYDKYHLQSHSNLSQINYGLYYNGELVAVMGFGKLRMKSADKENSYELHRYCVKSGFSVVGGSQRLFKYFINTYSPLYVKSYSDNNYFMGNMYSKMGFSYKGQASISYFWVYNSKKLKREQCQVKKLKELYPEAYSNAVESGASNKENYIMESIGACKVYTAGNSIWEYKV